jgi:hypothetical protein
LFPNFLKLLHSLLEKSDQRFADAGAEAPLQYQFFPARLRHSVGVPQGVAAKLSVATMSLYLDKAGYRKIVFCFSNCSLFIFNYSLLNILSFGG